MSAEFDGQQAAKRFRERHHLGSQPLGDLIALIEQTIGCDVAVLDVGRDEHGLTMHDPRNDSVFIGVACTRNPMRQRSTLAHELAHVVFKDWSTEHTENLDARTIPEQRADAFSRHLLIPELGLTDMLGTRAGLTSADLSAVTQRFLVSPVVAAIALHQAGYIDSETKNQWKQLSTPQLATRFGWSDYYAALQSDAGRRRSPQRLLARAITGYGENLISAQTIATLRGVSLEITLAELSAAGVKPRPLEPEWSSASDLPDLKVDLSDLGIDTEDETTQSESSY